VIKSFIIAKTANAMEENLEQLLIDDMEDYRSKLIILGSSGFRGVMQKFASNSAN
jgi:hypothetical protein